MDEKISHCPFCGTPYANHSPTNPISEIKMIIGSDGERTIQEKYWRDAQHLLNKLRAILSDRIERYTITANDDIFNRQGFHFINHNQLDNLLACDYVYVFSQKLEALCAEILEIGQQITVLGWENGLTSITLSANSDFDFEKEVQFIGQIYEKCNKAIDGQELSICEPRDPGRVRHSSKTNNRLSVLPLEYIYLSQTLKETVPVITNIVIEHSLIVLAEVKQFGLYEETDPTILYSRLQNLKSNDYDYLSDEDPVPFIRLFWTSLSVLISTINRIIRYMTGARTADQLEATEERKHAKLIAYIERWDDCLKQKLDTAYQNRSQNMMILSNQLSTIIKHV